MYRIVFLILGAVLLALASTLSQSLAFYYSSAMAVGIMLVVLLVLFQVASVYLFSVICSVINYKKKKRYLLSNSAFVM